MYTIHLCTKLNFSKMVSTKLFSKVIFTFFAVRKWFFYIRQDFWTPKFFSPLPRPRILYTNECTQIFVHNWASPPSPPSPPGKKNNAFGLYPLVSQHFWSERGVSGLYPLVSQHFRNKGGINDGTPLIATVSRRRMSMLELSTIWI